jgi:hypothetical protein
MTQRPFFPLLAVPVALGLVLYPCTSYADADADAQDLFVRARDLRAKNDCAGAVPLFRKANDLAPARLGSLRNVAECEETLGHFASARRAWLELGRGLLVTKETSKTTAGRKTPPTTPPGSSRRSRS